jgi:hypothetical protein
MGMVTPILFGDQHPAIVHPSAAKLATSVSVGRSLRILSRVHRLLSFPPVGPFHFCGGLTTFVHHGEGTLSGEGGGGTPLR